MKWLVFSSTLPSKARSSPRVALWRRLRRLGAISPPGGLHICTFETMVRALGLDDQVLQPMGEIIHDIDLRDGRYVHPETAGLTDAELEAHGVALFEGLYADLSRRTRRPPPARHR